MDLSVLENFQDLYSSKNISRIICWIVLKLIVGIISATYMEIWNFIKIEPGQNQQNKCVPSKDSDQPSHLPCMIRVFTVQEVDSFLHVDSKGRVPTSSGNHGISRKKFHAWKNHGI